MRDATELNAAEHKPSHQLIGVDGPELHACDLFYRRRTGGVSVIAHFAPAWCAFCWERGPASSGSSLMGTTQDNR